MTWEDAINDNTLDAKDILGVDVSHSLHYSVEYVWNEENQTRELPTELFMEKK